MVNFELGAGLRVLGQLDAALLYDGLRAPSGVPSGHLSLIALLPRRWLKLGKSFQNAGEQFGGLIPGAASITFVFIS